MLASPVGRRLSAAQQGEVGEGQEDAGRLSLTEGDSEVVELAEALGEDHARVGAGARPIGQRAQHHHSKRG